MKSPLAVTGAAKVDSIALNNVTPPVVRELNEGVEDPAEDHAALFAAITVYELFHSALLVPTRVMRASAAAAYDPLACFPSIADESAPTVDCKASTARAFVKYKFDAPSVTLSVDPGDGEISTYALPLQRYVLLVPVAT